MKRLVLHRLKKTDTRTLGRLIAFDDVEIIGIFTTLELPFKNNERNISCILGGYYIIEPRRSDKFGEHLIVNNVLNRDLILFHAGNTPSNTEGCILIGNRFANINADPEFEVVDSRNAMKKLTAIITAPAELIIL